MSGGRVVPDVLAALGQALSPLNPAALGIGLCSAALIFVLRRVKPNWPGMLIAVVLASVAAAFFHLDTATIARQLSQE